MNMFRILVADDHPIVRLGLCSLLGSHEGWIICGEAADGREAVEKCKELKPDLLILDICMPKLNGVDAARQILKHNPAQRILVVTDVNSEQVVRDCLDAGVRGWVFKADGASQLTTAVEAMQRRQSIFSSRVSDLILDGYLQRDRPASLEAPTGATTGALTGALTGAPTGAPTGAKTARLSTREREVVQLVAEGMTSKEVAATLKVAVKTAETHRSNVMSKLELHSIAELVLYAVRNQIVHIQLPSVPLFPPVPIGNGNHAAVSLRA